MSEFIIFNIWFFLLLLCGQLFYYYVVRKVLMYLFPLYYIPFYSNLANLETCQVGEVLYNIELKNPEKGRRIREKIMERSYYG